MLGDTRVTASSQLVTYRDQINIVLGATPGQNWYVANLPRQMVWANQIDNGPAVSMQVWFAIRDSAVAGTPEWLPFGGAILLVPGGGTPVVTQLVTGAVWLRFVINGIAAQQVELAASAFV